MHNIKLSSLNKGLVGHWTMSQDSLKGSLLADKTPYENDGTIYGATFTTDRKGKANSAMSFDGVDDYIDCGSNSSLQITAAITISVWVKIDNLTSGDATKRMIDKSTDINGLGGYVLGYRINNGGEVFFAINGSYEAVAMTKQNEWIHLLATSDDIDWKIYLNGEIIMNKPKLKNLVGTSSNLRIGNANTFDSRHKGSIADVRIYNRALSQAEITLLYNSYNPKIVMKTSLPKIKLYGGD